MDSPVASPTSSSPTVNGSAPAPSGIALEPRFYTDPALQAAEQELIFERTWQLAGHISQLSSPAATSPPPRAASPCSSSATTKGPCAPTSTSAATAARGS